MIIFDTCSKQFVQQMHNAHIKSGFLFVLIFSIADTQNSILHEAGCAPVCKIWANIFTSYNVTTTM